MPMFDSKIIAVAGNIRAISAPVKVINIQVTVISQAVTTNVQLAAQKGGSDA